MFYFIFFLSYIKKFLLKAYKSYKIFLDKKNKIGNEEEDWDIEPQNNGTWRLFEKSSKSYCPICGKGFNTKTALVQHSQIKH